MDTRISNRLAPRQAHTPEERNARIGRPVEISREEALRACRENARSERERQRAYEKARQVRFEREVAEREAWREERRNARVEQWVSEREGRLASDYPWGGLRRLG